MCHWECRIQVVQSVELKSVEFSPQDKIQRSWTDAAIIADQTTFGLPHSTATYFHRGDSTKLKVVSRPRPQSWYWTGHITIQMMQPKKSKFSPQWTEKNFPTALCCSSMGAALDRQGHSGKYRQRKIACHLFLCHRLSEFARDGILSEHYRSWVK